MKQNTIDVSLISRTYANTNKLTSAADFAFVLASSRALCSSSMNRLFRFCIAPTVSSVALSFCFVSSADFLFDLSSDRTRSLSARSLVRSC